jgi:hypothetical protein
VNAGGKVRTATAGDRLAAAEEQLLAALVAGDPVPPGFDAVRIRVQADALVAKRREVVARLRPDLVRAVGRAFRPCFDAYARAHPRPVAGARADAEAFARALRRNGRPAFETTTLGRGA